MCYIRKGCTKAREVVRVNHRFMGLGCGLGEGSLVLLHVILQTEWVRMNEAVPHMFPALPRICGNQQTSEFFKVNYLVIVRFLVKFICTLKKCPKLIMRTWCQFILVSSYCSCRTDS